MLLFSACTRLKYSSFLNKGITTYIICKQGDTTMKENMIMNIASVVSGSVAIAIACKVTRSAWPLLGFLIVPTFNYSVGEN